MVFLAQKDGIMYSFNIQEKTDYFSQLDSFYRKPASGGMELEQELLSVTDKFSDPYQKRNASLSLLPSKSRMK